MKISSTSLLLFTTLIACQAIWMVQAWTAMDIRTIPRTQPNDTILVYQLQAPLLKWKLGDILGKLHLFHTALGFRVQETGYEWTVEYDANDFFATVVPEFTTTALSSEEESEDALNGTELKWNNFGHAFAYESINSTYYDYKQLITKVNGTVHNQWIQWLAGANETFPVYNMFNVLNTYNADKSSYYLPSFTCYDFFEEAVRELVRLTGVSSIAIKRNDVNLYAREAPTIVEEVNDKIIAFYMMVTAKFNKMKELQLHEIIAELMHLIHDEIYLHHNQDYFRVKLHWPEFNWKYIDHSVSAN